MLFLGIFLFVFLFLMRKVYYFEVVEYNYAFGKILEERKRIY